MLSAFVSPTRCGVAAVFLQNIWQARRSIEQAKKRRHRVSPLVLKTALF